MCVCVCVCACVCVCVCERGTCAPVKPDTVTHTHTCTLKHTQTHTRAHRIGAYVILPNIKGKKGLDDSVEELFGSQADLQISLETTRDREVELQMPRFSTSYGPKCLKSELEHLGMSEAFGDTAEFDRITADEMAIGTVLHMATLDVDEYGTVATAATAVCMAKGMKPKKHEPIQLKIDRPFLFVIYDTNTQTMLFCAKIECVSGDSSAEPASVSGDSSAVVGEKRPRVGEQTATNI